MALSQKWKDSVEPGVTDAAWDKYDSVIQTEIAAYNLRLKNTPGYKTVDWKVVKAMIWVESGANSPAWTTAPIQIGVPGDPGLGVLQGGDNGSDLIMTTDLANRVKNKQQVTTDPNLNIQAGIAYLFTQMSKSDIISVVDDPAVLTYTVVAGDNLDKISKKLGTTVDNLKSQNSGAGAMIHPKDVLKYQKASMKRQILGWRDFTSWPPLRIVTMAVAIRTTPSSSSTCSICSRSLNALRLHEANPAAPAEPGRGCASRGARPSVLSPA